MSDDVSTLESGLDAPAPTTAPSPIPYNPAPKSKPEGANAAPDVDDTDVGSDWDETPLDDGIEDQWKGYVDFELDGQSYKIPDALKEGYMREKDYRQKTQATAAERKTLAERQQALNELQQTTSEELDLRAALKGIEAQLQQYEGVDFSAMYEEEPMGAQKHYMRFQQLRDLHGSVYGQITEAQAKRAEYVERDLANRIQETTEYAYKNLPGMSPELDAAITTFATRDLEYNPETLKQAFSPQIYRTLFLAHLGHQVLKQQGRQAPKTPAQAPQPLTMVSAKAGANARKSPAQMSVAEMAAYLRKPSKRS